jgi:hypothetical protein
MSSTVVAVGAVCFGVVVGWITYRSLRRNDRPAGVSDLASAIAAIGGGAVTALYGDGRSDAFGWYAIGLLAGFALYLLVSLCLAGREEVNGFMGDGADRGTR